ncbi:ERF1 [Symbiodinium microadriaticum]|nr:ERF1 [Symbiodinium microadriaticum]
MLSKWLTGDRDKGNRVFASVADGLQVLYKDRLLPVEKDFSFPHFFSPELTDADFSARPMVMLTGQYSTGKSTFIRHLLGRDYPGLRIGPEPTTDKFVAVCKGDMDQVIPGNALVVDKSMPFTQLSHFGNNFLTRFECAKLDSPVLNGMSLIDTVDTSSRQELCELLRSIGRIELLGDPSEITYMTDVEGHWSYFCNFVLLVELSEGLTFAEDGAEVSAVVGIGEHKGANWGRIAQDQRDGWHFVFGGDTCDKGYTSEFTDEEARLMLAYDMDHLTHEEIRHFCTKSNLMRYHLKYDMGSDGEFEFRRQELAHMSERNLAEVSDEEVVKSYEDSTAAGGLLCDYLRLAEIACILGSTLFVHGQIIGNQFYDCGHDGGPAGGSLRHSRPSDDAATFEWVSDLRVKQVNTWSRRSVAGDSPERSGLTEEVLGSLPMAPLPHVWATKRTNVARDHHVDVTDAWPLRADAPDEVPSVVYCRWLEGNCMPKSPWLIATRIHQDSDHAHVLLGREVVEYIDVPLLLPAALAQPADVKCAAPQRVLGSFAIMSEQTAEDRQIEQWKVKRLVKMLDAARGNGTSAITLILNSKQDINLTNKMLTEEYGTASCIKSRVNRLSVLSAITSTQQRLKKYNRTPPNGLIIFCGEVLTEAEGADNKEKKLTIDFEPFKPINTSMYLCDSKFHTEPLAELMEDDDKFGFLIMDGNGSLFGTVQGNHREILHKFTVDLPKKHGRGGQSALRFARLRLEKRHNYVRKVGETATQMFIPNGETPNIKGLIVAGSAEFKQDLTTNTDLFDQRLAAIVIPPLLDISYGGEAGFNQAIELSAETLRNVKFVQEKKLVTKFLDEVATDSGRYCFGIKDTMQGLEAGAVEILIIWEQLDIKRLVIRNPHTDTEEVKYVTPEQEKDPKLYVDKETNVELNVTENEAFLDWIVVNYKNFGTKLEFISDRSQEGNQFFDMLEEPDLEEADSDDDFM